MYYGGNDGFTLQVQYGSERLREDKGFMILRCRDDQRMMQFAGIVRPKLNVYVARRLKVRLNNG